MQDYKQLDPTEPLNKSIPSMMKSLNSVASGFSGTAFPTENLYVGMRCVRTDQNMEYICTKVENGKAEWTDVNKLTLHAGQAETDGSGNNIEQTYLKKGEAESTYLSKSDASNTYITSNKAAETYFPKTTGEALSSDVASNVNAVKSLTEKVNANTSSISEVNGSIDDLEQKVQENTSAIESIDISGKNFTVTASTQADLMPTLKFYGDKGEGVSATIPSTSKGISAGTYTLSELLQLLVNRSHSHTNKSLNSTVQCNCDCTC